jgi:O-antigen/teichoic acid export membrane protein
MTEKNKFLSNSFSLLINRLTQSITTFVLVASIARGLGAYQLGQYMLAFNFYYVFMTLASQGLKTLFTREIARNPDETPIYLVSGSFLQLIFCAIAYVALGVTVFALPYSEETSIVCYIMGLIIIPFSLSNVTEAVFQAKEKMHLIAISTVPIYILRLGIIILLLNLKYNLNYVSWVMLISETLILLIELVLISKFVSYKWHLDWDFIKRITKACWTFMVIEGISVAKGRVQILILSLLGGEVVVGLYSAVMQLMQPFEIIAHSMVIAFFPKMSQTALVEKDKQRKLTENLVEMLLTVALPFMLGLLFVGSDIILLIYKEPSFTAASTALNISAAGLVISAFCRPQSYALVANGFEKINLWDVITSTIIGTFLSIILVSKYQLNGAAISLLSTQIISFCIYNYAVYTKLFKINFIEIIKRPVIITLGILIFFLGIQKIHLNIIAILLIATVVYGILVILFTVKNMGGLDAVKAKFKKNKAP